MDEVVGEARQEGEVGFLLRTAVGMHPVVVTEVDTGRGVEDMRLTRYVLFLKKSLGLARSYERVHRVFFPSFLFPLSFSLSPSPSFFLSAETAA